MTGKNTASGYHRIVINEMLVPKPDDCLLLNVERYAN